MKILALLEDRQRELLLLKSCLATSNLNIPRDFPLLLEMGLRKLKLKGLKALDNAVTRMYSKYGSACSNQVYTLIPFGFEVFGRLLFEAILWIKSSMRLQMQSDDPNKEKMFFSRIAFAISEVSPYNFLQSRWPI